MELGTESAGKPVSLVHLFPAPLRKGAQVAVVVGHPSKLVYSLWLPWSYRVLYSSPKALCDIYLWDGPHSLIHEQFCKKVFFISLVLWIGKLRLRSHSYHQEVTTVKS